MKICVLPNGEFTTHRKLVPRSSLRARSSRVIRAATCSDCSPKMSKAASDGQVYKSAPASPEIQRLSIEVDRVLTTSPSGAPTTREGWDIRAYPPKQRATVQTARKLARKLSYLHGGTCERCWLQGPQCICQQVLPLPFRHRLWIYTHHDEVLLAADTCKLLLAAYPGKARLIVGDLPKHEEELFQVLQRRGNKAFVLFPAENASSFAKLAGLSSAADGSSEIGVTSHPLSSTRETEDEVPEEWDIVVLDGTWEQARRLNSRLPASARALTLCPSPRFAHPG
ncbi:hypothetical protein CYMTET_40108 [Cymbomonas tetramitiformis]|uniref:tRNA-uridine aminocarboxypropyltransferase n=1 Tax=Cymbomonas tetramitiformis TaxID=36881 RepID=A0AAE0C8T7_9CHLO|nr:hypothetical protein CYMTET_40108 [Cymbomonas tetramitiformis]